MKKKMMALVCMAIAVCTMTAGCGGSSSAAATEAAETTETVTEAATEAADPAETEAAETEAAGESAETEAAADTITEPAVEECTLEDGTYSVEFDTDSSMFHLNETCDGRATLTVKDGQMTAHIILASTHIVNLYYGSAAEAEANEADWIPYTEETVTYSDNTTDIAYGFDIPVPALDTDYYIAILGTKGTWYDHVVSVSDPQPAE